MKILVGYDGSGADDKVLQLAKQQAKINNASVEIVQVADLYPHNEADMAKLKKREQALKAVAADFERENISCKAYVEGGLTPGEIILDVAKREKVDLIIIGVRKRSRVGKFVFGSTTQLVVLNAPCPVLST